MHNRQHTAKALVDFYDEVVLPISDDPEVAVHEFKKLRKKLKKLAKKVAKPLSKVATAITKNPLLKGLAMAIPGIGAGIVGVSQLISSAKKIAAPVKAAVSAAKAALPKEVSQLIDLRSKQEARPNMDPTPLVQQQERVNVAQQVTSKLEALGQIVPPVLREAQEEEEYYQQPTVQHRRYTAPARRPSPALKEVEEVYEPEEWEEIEASMEEEYVEQGEYPSAETALYEPNRYYSGEWDSDEEYDADLESSLIQALNDRDWH